MISVVCRATDLRNSYFACVGPKSAVFVNRLFVEAMRMSRKVIIEEIQLEDPIYVSFGDLPPNAALCITFIDVDDIVAVLCEEAKKASLRIGDEPAAKRGGSSRNTDSLRLHHIAGCLRDQCHVPLPPDEAETDEVPNADDMNREMSAHQIRDKIMELLGPDAWYERITSVWAKNLLFFRLPLHAALKTYPLAMTKDNLRDENRESHVAGICAEDATELTRVIRPCFSDFAGESYPRAEQLQALCKWHKRMLADLMPVLEGRGYSYIDSIKLLQNELLEALRTAPHQGTGIESRHRGAFSCIEMNRQHACKCERCLAIFAQIKKIGQTRGIFAVLQCLYEKMNVGKVYSFCSFLSVLLLQVVVGSASETAVAGQYVMVGRQASGKTYMLIAIGEAFPSFMCVDEKCSSAFGELYGDPVAGFGTSCMVRYIRTLSRINELRINTREGDLTKGADGVISRNSGMPPSDKGQRQRTIATDVVWDGHMAIGACNEMAARNARGDMEHNAAMLSRWEMIHGMKIPNDVQRTWRDPILEAIGKCAQRISQHLLSMLDVQTFGLDVLTERLVPSFAVLIAAFDTLVKQTDMAGNISVRTTSRMRSVNIAAWRAEQTMLALLNNEDVSMKDILIGHASPVPYEFAIFILQASSASDCVAENVEPFGVLGTQAQLPEDPCQIVQRCALLYDIPMGDPAIVFKRLKKAATGITASPKFAAETMEPSLVPLPHMQIYGVPAHLLSMHPPQTNVDAARNILLILETMALDGRLLVDQDKQYVYLPHFLILWLNGQNVPLVDRLRNNEPVAADDVPSRAVHISNSDNDATVLAEISADLTRLAAFRAPGIAWALIHCGAECPALTGGDYGMNDTLTPFICDPPAEEAVKEHQFFKEARQKKSNKRAEAAPRLVQFADEAGEAAPIGPIDYVHGADALRRLDVSPSLYKPFRLLVRMLKTPPIGVSPSIRKIEAEMPLPGNMQIELMNNGVVTVIPRANRMTYGDSLTATPFNTYLDVCVHPNNQLGDILTCFVKRSDQGSEFSPATMYYMHTLYNILYTAPRLLCEISDDDIFRNVRHARNPAIEWAIDLSKERGWLSKGHVTSTVRMFILALVVQAAEVDDVVIVPRRFAVGLARQTFVGAETDIVPSIVKFITKKMTSDRLVACARSIAENMVKFKDDGTDFLSAMISNYDHQVKKKIGKSIDKWYNKLRQNLAHVIEPDDFVNYNQAFNERFKVQEGVY